MNLANDDESHLQYHLVDLVSARSLHRRPWVVFVFVAMLLELGLPRTVEATPAIRVVSTIPRGSPEALYIDSRGGLLYQVGAPHDTEAFSGAVEIRDLTSLKVRKVFVVDSRPVSPAGAHSAGTLAAVDSTGHRLFFPYSTGGTSLIMAVVDGVAGRVVRSYNLCSPVTQGAGCAPSGGDSVEAVAYSRADDLLYLLYETPADGAAGSPPLLHPAVLHVQAVEAGTGNVRWSYRVPGCSSLFSNPSTAPPLGRAGDSLYVGCVAGVSSPNTGDAGTAVVLKLQVTGGGAPQNVAEYAAPRIPSKGLFDPVTQRVFLMDEASQLTSVFDGAHDVWVGDISSAEQPRSQMGVAAGSGRLYLCGVAGDSLGQKTGGLLATDAGVETPASVGAPFPNINCFDDTTLSPIQADPISRRLFVPLDNNRWGVVQDDLPLFRPPPKFDPDEGAEDVPEKAGVTGSTLSAEAGAYGTRIVWVGGPNNAVDNILTSNSAVGTGARQQVTEVAGLQMQNRNRDIRFADVPLARISNDGVEGGAISIGRDERFEADLSTLRAYQEGTRESIRKRLCPNTGDCAFDTTNTPSWPFTESMCFAFGGQTDVPSDTQEGSSSKCDLKALSVLADATAEKPVPAAAKSFFTELGGVVSVGEATAHVYLHRDPKLGLVAVAEGVSRNIVIAGTVFIAEARATATASAAGHPGKAGAVFKPEFKGVRVLAPGGQTAFECTDQCVPSEVIAAINETLGPRIRARFPQPGGFLKGSAKGTTASVEQGFWDRTEEEVLFDKPADDLTVPAFEIQVNTDVFSHSGYIVQLAGVSAFTRYAIYRLPQLLPPEGPVTTTINVKPPAIQVGTSTSTTAQQRVVTRTLIDRIRHGVRWIFRWEGAAYRVLAAWALLLTPLYMALRRRYMVRGAAQAG